MLRTLSLFMLVVAATACRSTYYSAMETFGKHKRDILVDRVEDGRTDQEKAKEQFRTAMERFREVVNVPDSDLRKAYDRLNTELGRSESRAKAVTDRIASIETVAGDLFKEWEAELAQYSNANLKEASQRQLNETRSRYGQLISAMKRAESKMEPVLVAFRDHVLFLKHNLNAQAVAALQGEVTSLESDIGSLVRDMEAAIAEADTFISQMRQG